jgi:hypothetical protein
MTPTADPLVHGDVLADDALEAAAVAPSRATQVDADRGLDHPVVPAERAGCRPEAGRR